MIIDCTSDFHGHYPQLAGGDLLIVAGDLTATDTAEQYVRFMGWLLNQPYQHRIYIAGNHDNQLVNYEPMKYQGCDYLCDSGTEFEGFKIWGSPWTKTFKGMNPACKAFTFDEDLDLIEKWNQIPEDTDILITHSPPWTIGDLTKREEQVGDMNLTSMFIKERIRPKLWVFGHVHEGYGTYKMNWCDTVLVNASHVNERYEPVNPPIRIIL